MRPLHIGQPTRGQLTLKDVGCPCVEQVHHRFSVPVHKQQHAHRCAPSRHRPSTARQQLFMRASRASPFHSRDADGDGSRITLDLGTSRKAPPVRMKGVVGELCHQRGFVHARLEEQRKGGHRRRVSHDRAFQRARAATCEACGGGVGRFGEFSLE